MRKILKVARREYVETVKTKTFIISILMAPFIVVGILFFTSRISGGKTGPRPPMKVAITDLSGQLSTELKDSFDEYNSSNPSRQIRLEIVESEQENQERLDEQQKDKLRKRRLDVYIVLSKDIVQGSGKMQLYTHKLRASKVDMLWTIENCCNRAVINRRCQLRNISPDLLAELRRRLQVQNLEVGSGEQGERVKAESDRVLGMMVPFAFMYLMFFGIFVNGQQMLSNIIEEKSSRIIEVLLSALSPFQLMAGKILGLVGIGLSVVGLWTGAAYAAALWKGLDIELSAPILLYFFLYYILGFVLFSAMIAGIGSVCNTIKEAQNLMLPVTLIFILPLMSWFKIVQNPDGTLAKVLSYVPLVTPMVMVLRLVTSEYLSPLEIVASIVLLVFSVLVVMWAAAKVFRTGILMYGKKPRLREVVRWLRQA